VQANRTLHARQKAVTSLDWSTGGHAQGLQDRIQSTVNQLSKARNNDPLSSRAPLDAHLKTLIHQLETHLGPTANQHQGETLYHNALHQLHQLRQKLRQVGKNPAQADAERAALVDQIRAVERDVWQVSTSLVDYYPRVQRAQSADALITWDEKFQRRRAALANPAGRLKLLQEAAMMQSAQDPSAAAKLFNRLRTNITGDEASALLGKHLQHFERMVTTEAFRAMRVRQDVVSGVVGTLLNGRPGLPSQREQLLNLSHSLAKYYRQGLVDEVGQSPHTSPYRPAYYNALHALHYAPPSQALAQGFQGVLQQYLKHDTPYLDAHKAMLEGRKRLEAMGSGPSLRRYAPVAVGLGLSGAGMVAAGGLEERIRTRLGLEWSPGIPFVLLPVVLASGAGGLTALHESLWVTRQNRQGTALFRQAHTALNQTQNLIRQRLEFPSPPKAGIAEPPEHLHERVNRMAAMFNLERMFRNQLTLPIHRRGQFVTEGAGALGIQPTDLLSLNLEQKATLKGSLASWVEGFRRQLEQSSPLQDVANVWHQTTNRPVFNWSEETGLVAEMTRHLRANHPVQQVYGHWLQESPEHRKAQEAFLKVYQPWVQAIDRFTQDRRRAALMVNQSWSPKPALMAAGAAGALGVLGLGAIALAGRSGPSDYPAKPQRQPDKQYPTQPGKQARHLAHRGQVAHGTRHHAQQNQRQPLAQAVQKQPHQAQPPLLGLRHKREHPRQVGRPTRRGDHAKHHPQQQGCRNADGGPVGECLGQTLDQKRGQLGCPHLQQAQPDAQTQEGQHHVPRGAQPGAKHLTPQGGCHPQHTQHQ
jgi:hypothetical protein